MIHIIQIEVDEVGDRIYGIDKDGLLYYWGNKEGLRGWILMVDELNTERVDGVETGGEGGAVGTNSNKE